MRFLIFTLIAITITTAGISQDNKKTLKNNNWKTAGMFSLFGAQSGSRNWAAGSEKFSFAAAAHLNLQANTSWNKISLENNLDLAYALMNSTSQGIRKNDDKIDLYSLLTCGAKKIGIGVAYNLRTQFNNGFDYSESPKLRTSGFFAPAYMTFGVGANFKVTPSANVLAGWAARWVITTNRPYSFINQGGVKPDGTSERPLADLYGVDPVRKVRFETGPYISGRYNREIMKNVHYRTRLDVNANVLEWIYNIDVYWTNTVDMKVNKWLMVKYTFDLIQDDDVKMFGRNKNVSGVQLKSMLGVGLAAKF
jgi:hypothetical protein